MKIHTCEQRSEEWYALRAGKPTASEFSKLITSKGETSKSLEGYAKTLAAELYAGRQIDAWEGNQWSERGRELEDAALELYGFAHDVEIVKVGFITDDAETMGCSPDALVGDDGLVEIKCLKAERHIEAMQYYDKHGRCPTDYIQQAQGQLLITGRKWCDLVFHHPVLPSLPIRQEPDRALHMALLQHIPRVIAERDSIMTMLLKRGTPAKKAA